MKGQTINNLKDFVKAYSRRKTDLEISHMLLIPIDEVKNQRKKNSLQNSNKKTQNYSDK